MRRLMSVRMVLVLAGVAAVFVAGAAFAASSSGTPGSSFFDSLARHLGISTEKLADATKAAEIDQVDAALAAGRITKEQADALKARINASQPGTNGFFGFGFKFGPGGGPMGGHGGFGFGRGFGLKGYISTAADYLGLSQQDILQKLGQGQSLADVAKAQKKSVDGLEQALYDHAKSQLDQAVTDKRITSDQESAILANLKTTIDKIVNATPGTHMFGVHPALNGAPWQGRHGRDAGSRPII
jgi:hypothetical protein